MSAFFQVGLLLAGIVPGIAQGEVQQKQAIKRETEEIEAQVRIQQEEMLIQGIGDLFGRTAQ
jgi:VIT1/CCC1 family predicted Fe2+/Mn2+ transporter